MAIDRNDPRRPLFLAVNAARTLGVFTLLLVALIGIGMIVMSNSAGTVPVVVNIVLAGVALSQLAACFLYFVFAAHMKRMRAWAVTATLITASIHTLMMALGLVSSLVRGDVTIFNLILFGMFVAVGVLLIIYCSQSFRVIREFGAAQRGFEPIVPAIPVAGDAAGAQNVAPPPPRP